MSRELVEVYYDEENEDRETDLAWLFVIGDDEVWIPKSQIEKEERGRLGDGTVWIPEWLAIEKGLE